MDLPDDKSLVIVAVTILGAMTLILSPDIAEKVVLAALSGMCGMAIGKMGGST